MFAPNGFYDVGGHSLSEESDLGDIERGIEQLSARKPGGAPLKNARHHHRNSSHAVGDSPRHRDSRNNRLQKFEGRKVRVAYAGDRFIERFLEKEGRKNDVVQLAIFAGIRIEGTQRCPKARRPAQSGLFVVEKCGELRKQHRERANLPK